MYLISDTHFNHTNIIKYCNRPFSSVQEMNDYLITIWNETVEQNATIYILGDFVFNNLLGTTERLIASLKGRIKLIPGNHDKLKNIPASLEVLPALYELNYNKKHYVFCHYPLETWNRKGYGSIHCHGHSHSTPTNIKPSFMERRYDVGVDTYGGPVHIDDLENRRGWKK